LAAGAGFDACADDGLPATSSCVEQAESANIRETTATPFTGQKPFIIPPH
jgi:hypothetical protein